jgi:putative acyl-CoA dehydrogenase
VKRFGAQWFVPELTKSGAAVTRPEALAWAESANRHDPALISHSPRGERIDFVEFHPSWHNLLGLLRQPGLQSLPFEQPKPGAMVGRCAGYYLHSQLESGSLCPLTMTFASIPVLQQEPQLFETIKSKLFSREHDERDIPLPQKSSMMIGMGMTEKQGGSDVRTNRTLAQPVSQRTGRGAEYHLTGHKWFFSAPQCDAHLVLALTPGSETVSCFFVPRFAPDGSKNFVNVQRLKTKVGNKSNASSEVEFFNAYGVMVGEEGRGVPTIIEMANFTRLDCVLGSSGLMRASLVNAIHHTRNRKAFGKLLCDQPLMQSVLADLAVESEAATWLFARLADGFERSGAANSAEERAWRRIVTPAAKYWVCKRAITFTAEAMEVWGGNGYVETGPMGRFYREAPVNSIWEGSGNVMCLDVLRALQREKEPAEALLKSWATTAKDFPVVLAAVKKLTKAVRDPDAEANGRWITQQIALIAQATLLIENAPAQVRDAFLARFSDPDSGKVIGVLPHGIDKAYLINRAFPQ